MIQMIHNTSTTLFRLLGCRLVLFVILALSIPLAAAEDKGPAFDPNPLRPPDTSSPRDTLRTFITNLNDASEGWRRGVFDEKVARAYLRAVGTLDLSTTPHSDSWEVQSERALMLKELLDRIALPPEESIPGDSEIADGTITRWTVPDTSITIARIETGPRAGEFLFSADTVQRLHRYYAHAKHLPYKPGAAGIYEAWAEAEHSDASQERVVRNRLKPVDTSNPRTTLDGFLDSVNRAYALVRDAEAGLKATPPTMTREEARETELTATNFFNRAVATLDLSQVPEALRGDVGIETALQLKEILDRVQLPPVDTVPDTQMVAAAREKAGGPVRWRVPNTVIEIVEITEGEQQGQFLFSAATVARTPDFYEKIRDLPYRKGLKALDWKSPDKSEGFYESYISSPGYAVPQAHILGKLVDALPASLNRVYGGQTLWQWIGFLSSVLAFALTVWVIYRVFKRLGRELGGPLDGWLMILVPIIIAAIAQVLVDFLDNDLNLTGKPHNLVVTGGGLLAIAMWAWAAFLLPKAVAQTVIATPRMQEQSSEATLLRLSAGLVGVLLGAWIVIEGLQGLGADLIPLLAGLGVGGLALALAAQSTIANFIGGLILFVNKPVRVGDFCRYGEDPSPGWLRIGTVEDIGWISTRLRGIDRTVTNIPNAEFSKMHIVNITTRDRRLFKTTLGLRYETTPDQLRHVLTRLRELLLGHPMVTPDPARVRFVGLGAYSLDVEIFAYLRCLDQDTFLGIQEDLLLRVVDIVNEAGTGFAFPSQTAYLARDRGLDAERREDAESQVEHRRVAGKLPFPEFEKEEREQLEDILDYPSVGSPDYKPREDVSATPPKG